MDLTPKQKAASGAAMFLTCIGPEAALERLL